MAVETTGILTVELDTTKINQQAKDLQNNINKLTIIPPIKIKSDTTRVKQDIKDLESRFAAISKIKITPQIETGLTAKEQEDITQRLINSVKSYQIRLRNLRRDLQFAATEGKDFAKANLDPISNALRGLRTNVKTGVEDIRQNFDKLGKSAQVPEFAKAIEELRRVGGQAGSIGRLFKEFQFRIKEGEFQRIAGSYRPILQSVASEIDSVLTQIGAKTTQTASVIQQAQQKIAETKIDVRPKVDEQKIKEIPKTLEQKVKDATSKTLSVPVEIKPDAKIDDSGIRKSLDKLADQNKNWAQTEFVKRFEWSQARVALQAEAEAVFSRETVARQLFSTVFQLGRFPAQLGYFTGKIGETLIGLAKNLAGNIVRLTGAGFGVIGLLVGKALKKDGSLIEQDIRRFFGVLQTPIFIGFKTLQLAINKYTLSLVFGIQGAISNLIFKIFRSLGSLVLQGARRLSSSLRSAIGNLFQFGGAGGGAGTIGEFTGLSFGQLVGLGGVAVATKSAANLEEAILKVSTITGQSGKALKDLEAQVISISNEFNKSAVDIGNSLFAISSAGFRGEESFTVLRAALTGAKAGFADVNTIANTIVRTMTAYSLSARRASDVSDILFNTVKRGIVQFEDLAGQLPRMTALAESAGLKLEELSGAIANLTRTQQLPQVAIGLRQVFKSLISPTEQASDAIDELKISWDSATVSNLGFYETLRRAAPAFLGNKKALRELVGDVNAVNTLLSLSKNILEEKDASKQLKADIDAMYQRGTAMVALAQVHLGFNEQLQRFYNLFINILRNIGQSLLPYISSALSTVTDYLEKIATITNTDIKGFAQGILNYFSEIFSGIGTVILSILGWLNEKFGVLRDAVAAGAVAVIRVSGEVILRLVAILLKEILALILQGMSVLGLSIVDFFKTLWKTITAIVDALYYILLSSLPRVFTKISRGIGKVIGGLGSLILWFGGLIGDLFSWLFSFLPSLSSILPNFETAINNFKDLLSFEGLQKSLSKAPENFADAFKFSFEKFGQARGLFSFIGDPLKDLAGTIISSGSGIFSSTDEVIKNQAEGTKLLIAQLEKDYKEELSSGNIERARLTEQFIEAEKERLVQLTKDTETSKFNELQKRQQKLLIELAKARAENSLVLQEYYINELKNNFAELQQLQEAQREAQVKDQKKTVEEQANLIQSLQEKARGLLSATQDSIVGLDDLSKVLDQIFGKDVSRIARKYGVGTERAAIREFSKDVITARAAGFTTKEVDTIITRGLLQQSELLTQIYTAFTRTGQKLTLEEIQQKQLSGSIITLLDRVEALGLNPEARKALLQDKVTARAFDFLDKAVSADIETGFIQRAMHQFENIEQVRAEQDRRNQLQDRFNQLTGDAVSSVTGLQERNNKLERLIDQIEEELKKQEQLQNETGGA